ncbi:MAG TPA: shikimate kinase [Puia sp.]|nr:shikimate kinase [Puia sp.]
MKIFLIGFMGSGKTHWGKLLSVKLQLPFHDLDTEVVEKNGRSVSEIFAEKGEEYFRYQEKEVLEELVEREERLVLSCGGGTPCFFNNIDFMKKSGKVVWLNTSVETLKNRLLMERMSRPLIREIGDDELQRYIVRKLSERRMYYEQADVMVNEESITLEQLIQSLLEDETYSA